MNSNNQMIQKGKISSVEGKADRNGDKTTARVLPSTADSMVTPPHAHQVSQRRERGPEPRSREVV